VSQLAYPGQVRRRRADPGSTLRLPLAVGGLTALGSAAGQLVGVLNGLPGQLCAIGVAGIILGVLAWLTQPDTYQKNPRLKLLATWRHASKHVAACSASQ
jgi:hypothetical protein